MMQQGVPTNPPLEQSTTKPRQMPGGGGLGQGMPPGMDQGMSGEPQGLPGQGAPLTGENPIAPGGGGPQPPGAAPETGGDPTAPQGDQARVSMIAYDVRSTNPGVTQRQAEAVARQVLATMHKHGQGWPGGSGLHFQQWTDVPDGPITQRIDFRKKKQGPDRPTRPEGTGEERPPQGIQDEPEPRNPDRPKRRREEEDLFGADPEWYHGNSPPPMPEWADLDDLNHPDQPQQRSRMQRAREKAGPVTRRLMHEYGPEVAKSLWKMRKAE